MHFDEKKKKNGPKLQNKSKNIWFVLKKFLYLHLIILLPIRQ